MTKYTFKYSAFTDEMTYELSDEVIYVTNNNSNSIESLPYSSINKVQLAYNASMKGIPEIFFCDLTRSNGNVIKLKNLNFKSMANFEDKRESYTLFVKSLHQKLPANTLLTSGQGSLMQYFSYFMFILVTIMAIAFPILLIIQGQVLPALIIFIAMFLMGKKLQRYIRNNKPATYTINNIPNHLLPG